MIPCEERPLTSHLGPAFPESAVLSQTGCVNAPLEAISQASSRTQVFPVRSASSLSSLAPNGSVSERSIRWRSTLKPFPEISSTKRSGKVQRSIARTSACSPLGASVTCRSAVLATD